MKRKGLNFLKGLKDSENYTLISLLSIPFLQLLPLIPGLLCQTCFTYSNFCVKRGSLGCGFIAMITFYGYNKCEVNTFYGT